MGIIALDVVEREVESKFPKLPYSQPILKFIYRYIYLYSEMSRKQQPQFISKK